MAPRAAARPAVNFMLTEERVVIDRWLECLKERMNE